MYDRNNDRRVCVAGMYLVCAGGSVMFVNNL